jgi:RimJ/RimL family protein N-acetyltransferase
MLDPTKRLPLLRTDRLVLRPFTLDDAARVQTLAGAPEVYATTLNIPHPYDDGIAESWIRSHGPQFHDGRGVALAVTLATDGLLIGAITLGIQPQHRRAELGYWLGVPYWNQGYCTEAARAIVGYGFHVIGLHKISSRYMLGNGASERVMIKTGMKKEGELVDEIVKDGRFLTLGVYGLVRR